MSDSPIADSAPALPANTSSRPRRPGERGQGLTEYGVILMLIAIVCLVAVQILGQTTTNPLYNNITTGLQRATGG
jgi:Flp pilus assembly pilin Flp